ncbi:hypothetical protein TIFTF001_049698 [Ficus carica]
MLTSP